VAGTNAAATVSGRSTTSRRSRSAASASRRADVYAFGCLLFFALTGQVPFRREGEEARLRAHLTEPPPKPTELVPALPSGFDEVVACALAKEPGRRYQSAGDCGRAATNAARRPQAGPARRHGRRGAG
jgi:serine/threonine-protein kinase